MAKIPSINQNALPTIKMT